MTRQIAYSAILFLATMALVSCSSSREEELARELAEARQTAAEEAAARKAAEREAAAIRAHARDAALAEFYSDSGAGQAAAGSAGGGDTIAPIGPEAAPAPVDEAEVGIELQPVARADDRHEPAFSA
ncbi:hypothetical protein I5E68_07305 [Novosphingobium sp. YJ-S2-02]|uniref:Uncharacterized protein n=1 Tax=Novosphingobium aureum TaxID=2792964 RepID=A0A931HBH4_9SPHN|nr:hypothetical protein [Novosphingobium aureum]MBH0112757.1 hypothetical protein [Novosphingobium aureum]